MPGRISRTITKSLGGVLAFFLATAAPAAPDVRPSQRVRAAVVVRAEPTTDSDALARLRPGETLDFEGEVPGWYRVRLPDGSNGYVSKAWTEIVSDAVAGAPIYRVHFVDVGTGLATFVEGPNFALVYDGGSNDDLARGSRNRFLAYLRRVRPDLQVIDHLILSHPHRDHVELLPDLLDAYQIRNVWDSGRLYDSCGYRAFLTRVRAEPGVVYHDAHGPAGSHVAVLGPKSCYTEPSVPLNVAFPHGPPIVRGLVVPLGTGAQMTFLHADPSNHSDPNQNSVPVRLDLGGARLLFMGDAEAGARDDPTDPPEANSTEAQLIDCCKAAIRADLLVAGHHGSSTSSRTAFLDEIGARVFVISSGPFPYGANHVRLPDQSVVSVLTARGELWRTDEDDAACKTDIAKIGPDDDGETGGCDNILVRIAGGGGMLINYERIPD